MAVPPSRNSDMNMQIVNCTAFAYWNLIGCYVLWCNNIYLSCLILRFSSKILRFPYFFLFFLKNAHDQFTASSEFAKKDFRGKYFIKYAVTLSQCGIELCAYSDDDTKIAEIIIQTSDVTNSDSCRNLCIQGRDVSIICDSNHEFMAIVVIAV